MLKPRILSHSSCEIAWRTLEEMTAEDRRWLERKWKTKDYEQVSAPMYAKMLAYAKLTGLSIEEVEDKTRKVLHVELTPTPGFKYE